MLEKERLLAEGKTKRVFMAAGKPDLVIVENKNDITQRNNPALTKKMKNKAYHSTTITCAFFQALKSCGIPVAYQKRLNRNSFVAKRCQMIPLEVIVRRFAYGSYLKRYPNYETGCKIPHRFDTLVFEVFLKTTQGRVVSRKGKKLFDIPVDDPLIINPESPLWKIYNPEMVGYQGLSLGEVPSSSILPDRVSMKKIELIARQTFLVLEDLLATLNLKLIDFKLELGIGPDGELVLADVIDADSCRIRDENWEDLSKESFREGKSLEVVEKKYEILAKKLEKFISV